MSRSQPTRSVEAEKVRAATAEDGASNDNTRLAQQTLGGAVDGVTFTILSGGAVTPASADAYPGDTITLEQVEGLSFMQMCAVRNTVCACRDLVALPESESHMAIGTSYSIKQGSTGVYTIAVVQAFTNADPASLTNAVHPTSTGELRVGSHLVGGA